MKNKDIIKIKYISKNSKKENDAKKTIICNLIKCRICEKDINVDEEIKKCKTEYEKEIIIKHQYHMDCFLSIPRVGNFDIKETSYKSINYRKCLNCNEMILTKSSVYICPICNKCNRKPIQYNHKCENVKCNYKETNTTPVNLWICPKCNSVPNNSLINFIHHHKCEKCGFEEDTNNTNWTCPNCNYNKFVYHHICGNSECKYEEDTKGSNWVCPKYNWTNHGDYYHKCPECSNEEITNNSIWVCKKCEYNGTKYKHKCTNTECGYEETNSTPNNRWICPKCNSKVKNFQKFHFKCNNENCDYEEDIFGSPLMYQCPKCGWKPENSILYINSKYVLLECKFCNIETPHDKEDKNICLVCSGEYIWCEHCEQWETVGLNSKPNHWLFWTSETKAWIDENPEVVDKMQKVIVGFDNFLNSSVICGIYGWFINNQPIYYGESTDILTRSYNHIMHIVKDKEYWYDIVDHLDKNTLEIRILEKIDRNDYNNLNDHDFKYSILKEREIYYINRDKPDSQKCDGTDHIKHLEEREFKINY